MHPSQQSKKESGSSTYPIGDTSVRLSGYPKHWKSSPTTLGLGRIWTPPVEREVVLKALANGASSEPQHNSADSLQ